jgi:hypothetical protein
MGTSVKIQLDSVDAILARRYLNNNGPAQKFMASEIKRLCDPYVPFLHGPLKNTAQVQQDGVLYVQPYARKQYYENNRDNGQRGKYWDKRMIADHGRELLSSLAHYVGGQPK